MHEMDKGREGSSLHTDIAELRAAVGLEQRESTSNNEATASGGDTAPS
jgi:hypothetical protein